MSIIQGNAHTSAGGGYQIERSLRFNSADSAYLSRTFAASSGTTDTFSFWVKRSGLGSAQSIFDTSNGVSTSFGIFFTSSDALEFYDYSSPGYRLRLVTTQVFRDPSAWYHIVCQLNTSNATAANRAKVFVNGVEVVAFSTATYPAQNTSLNIGSSLAFGIGVLGNIGGQYLNGYLTEFNFIDGQALTPSSFGQTNASTGVWEPIPYTGTYGTNGFELLFADNSGTTSTTLGKDSSGNGNNWAPTNFSVTAGAGNDSLVDSPTSYGTDTGVGGEVRGNYATLNPLDKNSGITLSNGNLDASMPTQLQNVYGTVSVTSGKWYWETTINSMSGRLVIGVGNAVDQSWNLDPASSSALWGYYSVNGNKLNGSNTAYGNSFTANDVIGVAVDMDSGKIWFSKNNTWQASGDPAAGTNAAFTNLSGSVRPMYDQQLTNAVTFSCNFGQRAFAYTAPSGFKALCTQNLPTPTIGATSTTQAGDYFNPVLYTGTGATRSVTGVGFQPSFIWFKRRDTSGNNVLVDAVRGVNSILFSDLTAAQDDDTGYGLFTSFDSDGFTLGNGSAQNYGSTNANGSTYVAWNWKANGAGSSNTAGTITSTVSANTTSGFSVVTYTGTGSNATVGHGLGVAPDMVIAKLRSNTSNWPVYHRSLDAGKVVWLDLTNAQTTSVSYNGAPTSSIINLGTAGGTNTSSGTHVIYAFAAVAGYSAFGSYTGNGSTDGPFVYTGFRPKYLLLKLTNTTGSWQVKDSARNTYNVTNLTLYPNLSNAEASDIQVDFLSNGFKLRSSTGENANGNIVIYAAFAETPAKFSLAR